MFMFRNLFFEIKNNFSIITAYCRKILPTSYTVGIMNAMLGKYIVFEQNMSLYEGYFEINLRCVTIY